MKPNKCRLRKIVEEQRQEIESLNLHINRLKVCYEMAKEEIEKLQAQMAVMREALTECIQALELCSHKELCKITVSPYDMIDNAKKALATDAGKDYHNPKDIEALEKAREALAKATYTEEILPNWEYKKIVYEAIEAIDKTLGNTPTLRKA